jgi:hypothetical protein
LGGSDDRAQQDRREQRCETGTNVCEEHIRIQFWWRGFEFRWRQPDTKSSPVSRISVGRVCDAPGAIRRPSAEGLQRLVQPLG